MNSVPINPPKQSRSQRTLERIVDASLELLATQGPSGLTVQNIVLKADASVGSFYARFRGKDDLLDYLGERVWAEALERWTKALATRDWKALELTEAVEGAVGLLIDAQRSRSAYLKALDATPGGQNDAFEAFRTELLVGLADIFMTHVGAMSHPHPERAVRLGLRAVMGVIDAEFRVVHDRLDRETLVDECRALLLGYLTGDAGEASGTEGVDFFDVWG